MRGGVLVMGGAGVPWHSGAPGAPQPGGRSGPMSQTTSALAAYGNRLIGAMPK